ncbi:hypothetical protein F5Y16DRAFT_396217 [Xylariaceae sp. FL0255]|nr:hypothetical protein F5Y16DRAFT_396217 [Xylariaceae sp. FL0255]
MDRPLADPKPSGGAVDDYCLADIATNLKDPSKEFTYQDVAACLEFLGLHKLAFNQETRIMAPGYPFANSVNAVEFPEKLPNILVFIWKYANHWSVARLDQKAGEIDLYDSLKTSPHRALLKVILPAWAATQLGLQLPLRGRGRTCPRKPDRVASGVMAVLTVEALLCDPSKLRTRKSEQELQYTRLKMAQHVEPYLSRISPTEFYLVHPDPSRQLFHFMKEDQISPTNYHFFDLMQYVQNEQDIGGPEKFGTKCRVPSRTLPSSISDFIYRYPRKIKTEARARYEEWKDLCLPDPLLVKLVLSNSEEDKEEAKKLSNIFMNRVHNKRRLADCLWAELVGGLWEYRAARYRVTPSSSQKAAVKWTIPPTSPSSTAASSGTTSSAMVPPTTRPSTTRQLAARASTAISQILALPEFTSSLAARVSASKTEPDTISSPDRKIAMGDLHSSSRRRKTSRNGKKLKTPLSSVQKTVLETIPESESE